MWSIAWRRSASALIGALIVLSAPGRAEPASPNISPEKPPWEPAFYLDWMKASKMVYEIGRAPLEDPLSEISCPHRDVSKRVVFQGGKLSVVPWQAKPEAREYFEKAEKAFEKKRFDAAGKAYLQGLAIDPDWAPGWILAGDIPYSKGDFEGALESYRRGLAIDNTLATGHWFASDALRRLGRWEEAEKELIEALVYDPSYKFAWDRLAEMGKLRGFTVTRPGFDLPQMVGKSKDGKIAISFPADPTPGLIAYSSCEAVWVHEPSFREKFDVAGGEGVWSLVQERTCLLSYLYAETNAAKARLVKERAVEKSAIPSIDVIAALEPRASLLMTLLRKRLLDGFILVELFGQKCAAASAVAEPASLEEARRYLTEFVVRRSDRPSAEDAAAPGTAATPPQ